MNNQARPSRLRFGLGLQGQKAVSVSKDEQDGAFGRLDRAPQGRPGNGEHDAFSKGRKPLGKGDGAGLGPPFGGQVAQTFERGVTSTAGLDSERASSQASTTESGTQSRNEPSTPSIVTGQRMVVMDPRPSTENASEPTRSTTRSQSPRGPGPGSCG